MLKFIQTHATGSDCTAPYDVILDKPYTVGEFINEVLTTRPNEWGEFIVRHKGSDYFGTMARAEYRYGEMKNRHGIKTEIPEEFALLPIKEVKAAGGWSAMDYNLIIDWLWR